MDKDRFVEVELGEGTGNFIKLHRGFDHVKPKAQPKTLQSESLQPEYLWDEKRMLFSKMRKIAREDQSLRMDHAKIFFKQGVLMKDFEDDFDGNAPFLSYYPYYQLMGYDQLRTYFTWRAKVRRGIIEQVSTSYAFVYIYELLNNIGVASPEEGLSKLMAFWKAFRKYSPVLDKYVISWIKDYHVCYKLSKSFKDFAHENNMCIYYPQVFGPDSDERTSFPIFSIISRYDIKSSSFYTEETSKLIDDCFYFVLCKLREVFDGFDMSFDDLIFQPMSSRFTWTPFSNALYYHEHDEYGRKVELSESETYTYNRENWLCRTVIITESGRHLVGFVLKQMESALRKVTKFKRNISANRNMISDDIEFTLTKKGIVLEKIIEDAVLEYHSILNRKTVSVDLGSLDKIRLEALDSQDKLLVDEEKNQFNFDPMETMASETLVSTLETSKSEMTEQPLSQPPELDEWSRFKATLTTIELEALTVIQHGGDVKSFADEKGIMLEVLIDSINEKAFDTVNDAIIDTDDGFTIYEEYIDKL